MRTFGSVQPSDKFWLVKCEPHVRARLKRVFARAPQERSSVLWLAKTPENSRELAWFLERYPMEVQGAELLEQLAQEHRDREAAIARVLMNHVRLEGVEMAKPPRDYQLESAAMLATVKGMLLADDVGAGKTVTAICSMTQPEGLPALVVCPTHMPRHWLGKLDEFLPGLRIHVLKKGTPYPMTHVLHRGKRVPLKRGDLPDVVITNYHKLRGWASEFAGAFKYVIFDEVQQLRSPKSQIYEATEQVVGRAALVQGLSATPIYNYGGEIYWVLNAIRPGALGPRDEFVREWCSVHTGRDTARLADPEEFGAYVRREGLMIRRTLKDIGRELLPVSKEVHTVEADVKVLAQVEDEAVRLAGVILAHNENQRGEKFRAAGEFDNIVRQATGISKAPAVAAFVRMLLDSEQRVMLFGWHHAVYDIWMSLLEEFKPVRYTGLESEPQKAAALNAFTEGESRVLIMSLRSGAGVDGLQDVVRVGVFGELDWSPGVHDQCIGRFHRDDQDEPCVAYFVVTDDGADPIMMDVLGIKRDQAEGVRNPDAPLASRDSAGERGVKQVAAEYLRRRGLTPAAAAITTSTTTTDPGESA